MARGLTVPKITSQVGSPRLYEALKDIVTRSSTVMNEIDADIVAMDAEKVGGSGTAGYLASFSDPKTLTNSPAYTDGTNIGVGTTSPGQKVDVNGAVRVAAGAGTATGLHVGALVSTYGGRLARYPNDALLAGVPGATATQYFAVVKSTGAAVATFLGDGNVGIGATSPGARLEIDNGITAGQILLIRDGGNAKISVEDGGALCGNSSKNLTTGVATGFVEIAVASGAVVSAEIDYEVEANDSTDYQVVSGALRVSAVNKAGTVTCSISEVGSWTATLSSGTLTVSNTCTAGTAKITVNCNAVSSLTETTLRIKYNVRSAKPIVMTSL